MNTGREARKEIEMDALNLCNACDAAPMIDGFPHCAECLVAAAQATVVAAREKRDAESVRMAAALDSGENLEAARTRFNRVQDALDEALDMSRKAHRAIWAQA